MAGLQVILQAWASDAAIVEPDPGATPLDFLDEFSSSDVDSLSGTPSRWRALVSIEKFRQLPIKNITLGGEIADQVTLDKLRDLFPTASIRHVYATTETGPVFSVSDGLEGFPANLLNRELSSGKRLSINEGELVVSFSPGVESQAQKVVKTGDLVVRKDDRIRFIGRIGDVVNVGGVKVSLSDVESHCNALPGVVDSLVKAISNPFVGYVIKAEIQWESKPLTDREVRSLLSKDLQKAAVPAVIVSVQTLDLSENFKKVRKE
jgi:acyl-coenzyme A synthetase/AMP-(fatty) acid ligase